MGRQVVDAREHSDAPPEAVWRLVSDSTTYPDRALAPCGVLHTGGTVVREEITAFDPPNRLAYKLLEGLPIKDYEAEVTLDPAPEGGTNIRWHAEFEPKFPVPGFLVRRKLRSMFSEVTAGLAKAAAG